VLGILPGLLGVIQATETIKLLLGLGNPLIGRLLTFDALAMRSRELRLKKNPACPACGDHATLTDLSKFDYDIFCGVGPGDEPLRAIAPAELHALRRSGKKMMLLDVRDPHEWEICRIADAVHIPLSQLSERTSELNKDEDIYVYCLMGGRSRKAQDQLLKAGFSKVVNVDGGIRAWAKQVDPDMSIY
jgi:adenylyltransferase/sulfurtransferase